MITGFTQVVAVIGHPINQVKSPENFNRYFAQQQMDSVMIPIDIEPDAVAGYLNALRGWKNMSGVLVTVPHKQRVAALLDELSPRALHLNAVNVVRKLPDGRLKGDMLDGVGFLLAAKEHNFQSSGKKALLSGCGGVGSAIAWGLCEAGATHLAIYDQNPAMQQSLFNRLATHFPHVHLSSLPETLQDIDILINGSPAGMVGFDPLPIPPALLETLTSATHVADVVTAPVMTPLLTFAQQRGCVIQTGPEMALAQMKLMGEFIGAMPQQEEAAA
ncbi:shikimate dehydrogenase [Escherichia fergusonii]|uniref:shikimate dehydrogenase family protein n=1 Tax=Escherichia fergusonii TaxID=564 RepID=UPI0018AAB45E|nr:shikimate dehydrogenase [Escherichia fergusonii]EHG6149476.1 shikimate dehydrogenase [Escherichia fergusonii]EHG6206604.1 shikimate dehydrogenase [Escherichia fergusonii]